MGGMNNKAKIWPRLEPGVWHVVRTAPEGEDRAESLAQYSRFRDSARGWAYRNGTTCKVSRIDNGRTVKVMIDPRPNLAERAAALIDGISGDNPEVAHIRAEEILVRLAPPEVRAAYERLAGPNGNGTGRAAWWAFA
jgi:hypothetical protein